MRLLFLISMIMINSIALLGQSFQFTYEGPDTLFVGADCTAPLDWGHPDQPTVSSTIGANIDSFFIYSITNDYELNELIGPDQSIEVTYKAVDDQGNVEFFTFTLVIADNQAPSLLSGPVNMSLNCDEANIENELENWFNTFAGISAEDNCTVLIEADKSWSETLISFNQSVNDLCGNTRMVSLEFTVMDEAGNSLEPLSAFFETVDITDPEFTSDPEALVVECTVDIDQILEDYLDSVGGATAIDNCSQSITWSFLWSDNTNDSGFELVGNKPYNLQMKKNLCTYLVNINFFAEDECGNREASFTTISISDNQGPEFSLLPQDTTVNCDQLPEIPEVLAFDACKGELIVLFEQNTNKSNDNNDPGYYNYEILQAWAASDGCGHDISHTRIIEVKDTMAPEFDLPPDISIDCAEIEDFSITGEPGNIEDACSEFFNVYYEDRIQGEGCSYIVLRDWYVSDVSGNIRMKTQELTVLDQNAPLPLTLPSDLELSCQIGEAAGILFYQWMEDRGDAIFEDECNPVLSFVAVPGTYDPEDINSFPGEYPSAEFLFECVSDEEQLMFQQLVDFVFYDECGNVSVHQNLFSILDEDAPTFNNCPGDSLIILAEGTCAVDFTLAMVEAIDNCTGQGKEWTFSQRFSIDSEIPGDKNTPVDTLEMNIGPINLDVLDLEEILSLELVFNNMDADDNNEYFVIRGEDGSILGITPEIDEECGDFTIDLASILSEEQLVDWLDDGYLNLILEPYIIPGNGIFSINDICGNSSVQFSMVYTTKAVSRLNYSYSINGEEFKLFEDGILVDTLLSGGSYEVVYRVEDCAGNQNDCIQIISISDLEAPELLCPGNLTQDLENDLCTKDIELPVNIQFTDNCLEQWRQKSIQPEDIDERFISFSFDQGTQEFIADNMNFTFQPNPLNYLINPILTLFIRGDIEESGEYFELLDENGLIIGQSPQGSCDSITTLKIDLDQQDFNAWLEDGIISFIARSSIGTQNINPCNPSSVVIDGDQDGVSQLYLELSYDQLDLRYRISGSTELEEKEIQNIDFPLVTSFNGGNSILEYILTDQAMNADTCTLEIQLRDKQAPVALCKEAIAIFVHPSGIDDYHLEAELIDAGSYDNCSIDSMAVHPSVFNCSQAGTTQDVMFYVWDVEGNVDSCLSSVKVETMILEPSYQAGVCAFDTLKLFSNLPDAPEGIYTILWTKQNNGFSSNEENPVRPNADAGFSGTYTLEVSGLNGCLSTGFVEVFIEDLSKPLLFTQQDTVCFGENIILESNSYSGNVLYKWYSGVAPGGVLIDSSFIPILEVSETIGTHNYYLVVESENCNSLPSQILKAEVLETPDAMVSDPFINLCEGDDIVLGTDVSGPGFTYLWWGPDSYLAQVQNPAVIENAEVKNQGSYQLAIFNGICSDTAVVEVIVNNRPITPIITSDSIYCEGDPMVLTVANITNADNYSWYIDDGLYTVQNTNTLVIGNAQSDFEGSWSVIAKSGNCYSERSPVKDIKIEVSFELAASNTGPVCFGDSIELIAPEIPGALYTWIGPANDTFNVHQTTILAQEGLYLLEVVTSSGCILNSSTFVEVPEVPEITALSNNAPECIDGNECIEFVPSVFPNLSGYTYIWSGPEQFASSDSIAERCMVDTSFNGVYNLIVSNGVCESEMLSTEVNMFGYPPRPEIVGEELFCENDTLILTAIETGNEVLEYYWNTPSGNVFQTNGPELVLPHIEPGQTGSYSLETYNGHCYSPISETIYIEILKKPNQPAAWTEESFCEGEAIKLFTSYVEEASYHWEGPNGYVSILQNPVIFPSDTLDEGVYRLYISIDGCDSEISEAVVVQIKRKPDAPELVAESEPICIVDSTSTFEICLQNQQASTSYNWYHNETGLLIGSSETKCMEFSNIEFLLEGVNTFYAIAELEGCSSERSELVEMNFNMIPDKLADAGDDLEVCNDIDLYLSAANNTDGSWTVMNENILVVEDADPNSAVMHLEEGNNYFIWSLSNGACLNYDIDTVNIFIFETPLAINDQYQSPYNTEIILDPILNDQFADMADIFIDTENISYGQLEEQGINSFYFIPSPEFVGQIQIPYELIHQECPDKRTNAIIYLDIGDANDCFGVNVITPNGDGVNDELLFPCLENPLYPKNKLIVFNQWGDEVYSTSPYKNDWQGTYKGKDLPVGTYYYILDLRNGSDPVKNFFVIER